jgi:uncharacterized membrane protein
MANNPQISSPQQGNRPSGRRIGATMMLRGIIAVVLGIILTVIAQAIADSTGSNFTVVFTGLVVVGALYTIAGFFRWLVGR